PAEEDPPGPEASDTYRRPATDPGGDALAVPREGSRRRAARPGAMPAGRRLRAERRLAPRGLRRVDQEPAREDGDPGAELGARAGPLEPRGDDPPLAEKPGAPPPAAGHAGVVSAGGVRGDRPRAAIGGCRSGTRRARAQRSRRAGRVKPSSNSPAAPASIVRPFTCRERRCAGANALSSRSRRAASARGSSTIEAQSRRQTIRPQSATPACARQRGLRPETATNAEAVRAIAHRTMPQS